MQLRVSLFDWQRGVSVASADVHVSERSFAVLPSQYSLERASGGYSPQTRPRVLCASPRVYSVRGTRI